MFRLFRKDEDPGGNRLADDDEALDSADGELDDPDVDDEHAEEAEETEEQARKRQLDLDAELAREAEEFGLTSSDPIALYGPRGEDVVSVLDALTDLDDDTADALAEAYWAVPAADRRVARSVVRRLRRDGDLDSELWAAEQAVADWLGGIEFDDDRQDTYGIAADAATDAVDALILEDVLADVDFATLYGAWSEVMDSDEDDEAEDEDAGAEDAEAEEPEAAGGSTEEAEAAEDADEDADGGEFGPNTDLIEQLFARLDAVEASEITALVDAWRDQPKEALRVAHRNLQELADEDKDWKKQLQKAQDEILAWINGNSERILSRAVPATNLGPREVAGPAVADAVAALVMADMLETRDARTLYAPWADVMKEPALPEFEDDETAQSEGDS